MPAIALTGLLSLHGPAVAQDTTAAGAIRGSVRDATGAGVIGARVCALETSQCTRTDVAGTFRVDGLRAGRYRLEIVPPAGLPITSDPIEVRAGLEGSIEVTLPKLEQLQQVVTVTAPAFVMPGEVKSSGFLVDPRSVLKSAGALQDVSRYVQSLPGVVLGTDDFRNDIIVRGGSPLENLFIVDNVEIPNINSFATFASAGGTTSLLDAEMLQDVTFLSGGYPAPYINRTSGVLQVTQREGDRNRWHGRATLGFAGAGGIVEGPFGGGKGSWIVSARRSFLDLFTDDIGVGGVPVLYTLNAKVVYDVTDRDRVWAVNVSGWDRIRLGYTGDDDQDNELSTLDIRYQGWRAATGFNWQRLFGARGVGLLGLSYSPAKTGQRVKDLVRDGIPPPSDPGDIIADSPTVYFEDSREDETTLKYDLTLALPGIDKLQLGGSVKAFRLDYNAASPYGNDTPYSPVPGVDPFVLNTRLTASQSGLYVQGTVKVTSRIDATLGGRLDHYGYLAKTRVSPRAGVSSVAREWSVLECQLRRVLSAAPLSLSRDVPGEPDARSVARRSLRDRSGVDASTRIADDRRGVPQDLSRLSGGGQPPDRVAGEYRRHVRCARDSLPARQLRPRPSDRRRVVSRQALRGWLVRHRPFGVLAYAPRRAGRGAATRIVRLSDRRRDLWRVPTV